MSTKRPIRPRFDLARVYDDGRQQVDSIELRNIGGIFNKGARVMMGRRGFIGLSALGTGALLAACGAAQATTNPTATATQLPTATPTPIPLPMGVASPAGLLVRTGPDFTYPEIYRLLGGTRFQTGGRDDSASWIYMRYSHATTQVSGWVAESVTTLDPPVPVYSLPVVNVDGSSLTPGTTPGLTPTQTPGPTPTEGTYPTAVPTYDGGGGGGGGGYCSCNEICTCIPVYY